jgi:hypothetical protein
MSSRPHAHGSAIAPAEPGDQSGKAVGTTWVIDHPGRSDRLEPGKRDPNSRCLGSSRDTWPRLRDRPRGTRRSFRNGGPDNGGDRSRRTIGPPGTRNTPPELPMSGVFQRHTATHPSSPRSDPAIGPERRSERRGWPVTPGDRTARLQEGTSSRTHPHRASPASAFTPSRGRGAGSGRPRTASAIHPTPGGSEAEPRSYRVSEARLTFGAAAFRHRAGSRREPAEPAALPRRAAASPGSLPLFWPAEAT